MGPIKIYVGNYVHAQVSNAYNFCLAKPIRTLFFSLSYVHYIGENNILFPACNAV